MVKGSGRTCTHVAKCCLELNICLLQVTDEVRPLQQGSDLEMADLSGVQAEQLYCCTCIADYCGTQSQTHDICMLNEAIIQANFSHFDSESVLSSWPAEDVSKFQTDVSD